MSDMLGRSSNHTESLTGLLRIIKDPAAVEAHINKIKAAEDSLQATLQKGKEEQVKYRAKLADLDNREKVLNEKERVLTSKQDQLRIDEAALTAKQQAFSSFEAKTTLNLSNRAAEIKITEASQAAQLRALTAKEKELNNREQTIGDRERAVKVAESEHLARAQKLREALG